MSGSKVAGQDRLFFAAQVNGTREVYSLVLTYGSDGTPSVSLP